MREAKLAIVIILRSIYISSFIMPGTQVNTTQIYILLQNYNDSHLEQVLFSICLDHEDNYRLELSRSCSFGALHVRYVPAFSSRVKQSTKR